MEQQTAFNVIGIAVRTTNENEQAMQDIPALWARFMSNNLGATIPNKVSDDIYCLYTEYEKDHTRPYTTLIGCKVSALDTIPEGMVGKTIEGGSFSKYIAKGNLTQGAVYNEWINIWATATNRAFTTDYEIYGAKAANPEDGEVDIFVGVRER
jgi:predicted transcriptional regulator YdeE